LFFELELGCDFVVEEGTMGSGYLLFAFWAVEEREGEAEGVPLLYVSVDAIYVEKMLTSQYHTWLLS